MKIISWNVNGLKAALTHGIKVELQKMQADVYLLQETRAENIIRAAELKAYYPYWGFCRSKKGYAGVMCMSKEEPLSVSCSIGSEEFDNDGRVMTLEFRDFYLVNCYSPTAVFNLERKDYREIFDEVFYQYLKELKRVKEVIVCGDFNVAFTDRDMSSEDRWLQNTITDFKSSEKVNMALFLDSGFVDSFRHLYPKAVGHYTWWSPKNCSRELNRGERLDYAIVSEGLGDKIIDSKTHMNVMGSDHCPIELDIDLELIGTARTTGEHSKYRKNEIDRTRSIIDSPFGIIDLGAHWDNFDWEYAEKFLTSRQHNLAKAAVSLNWNAIERIQSEITGSIYCKALAVRKVCGTRSTPGVDGVIWKTSRERMEAAISLTPEKYEALPDKLVLMRSRSDKVRRIHIGNWYDRAMQTLFAYALDPIAESWADKLSFAYRKGRGQADVAESIRTAFSGDNAPKYAFIGDITQCYESITHSWILSHIPIRQDMLKKFLKAGFVFGDEKYEPLDEGIGIGCSISPIIANMALDGLDAVVKETLRYPLFKDKNEQGLVVRFADDFLVPIYRVEDGERLKVTVDGFLQERGMRLSEEKTKVVSIEEGFDFTKKHYRLSEYGYVYVGPSKASIDKFKFTMQETIQNFSGTQKDLIKKLNQKISGWANQYRMFDSERIFKLMDVTIESMLLEKCIKTHPGWKLEKIKEHYFYAPRENESIRVFALPNNKAIRVNLLRDYPIYKHKVVKTWLNPYIDRKYFDERTQERDIRTITGRYRSIWNRQEGRCWFCGKQLLPDQEKCIREICLDGESNPKEVYVHSNCTERSVSYIDVDLLPDSERDVMEILQGIFNRKIKSEKYHPLAEYFHSIRAAVVRLDFNKIEEIMGMPLPESSGREPFWTRTGFGRISQCWLEEGYSIRKLGLKKRTVTFYRFAEKNKAVNIPDVFFSGHIPDRPKYELETFLKYILEKYDLE